MPKITGNKAVGARLRRISDPAALAKLNAVVLATAEAIQVDAQNSITEGAVSGKNHVPSTPGAAPNNDSGVLANNIEAINTEPLTAVVSSSAPYAAALEFGTSKMAARPYMAPAAARARQTFIKDLEKAVSSIIRQGKGK